MALKSTTKKAAKPAASAKPASAPKSAAAAKPAARASKPAVKAEKAPAKASAVVKPAPVAVKAVQPKPASASARPAAQTITLTYFAPEAGSVLVAGDFTKWEASPISLVKAEAGLWKTTLSLKPGKYEYRLLVDGQWQNDPQCAETQPNAFGSANCVLSVAA